MKLLLDTHALLWWWLDDPRLTRRVRSAIDDPRAEVHVSAATALEITTKVRIGKLPAVAPLVGRFEAALAQEGFRQLPVTVPHAKRAGMLAGDHRDPFDRILAAQSIIEALPIVTADARIQALGARTFW